MGIYKCCYNCEGGMKCAVPKTRREDNADYYDRCIRINETSRFCGINYAGSDYAKDAFRQRYCKNFEIKDIKFDGQLLTKVDALVMYEKLGCKPGR